MAVAVSLAFILLTASLGETTCPQDTFLQLLQDSSSKCCEMCPPGHYVESPCTAVQSTTCKPCKPHTYMNAKTDRKECTICTLNCNPLVMKHQCNETHNTICGCTEGKYLHRGTYSCFNCTTCKEGLGVKRRCTTTDDTVCHPCPPGTFSSTESATEKCQPCTICKVYQVVSRKCTPAMDCLCIDPPGYNGTANYKTNRPLPISDTSINVKPTAVTAKRKSGKSYTVPVIVCVSSLLVFFVVGVFCWYGGCCRGDNAVNNNNNNNNNGRGNANAEEERGSRALLPIPPDHRTHLTQETLSRARSSRGLRGRKSRNATRESQNSEGSSSGSSCSLQGATEVELTNTHTLARDLPYDVVLGIAFLLNPKGRNNWTRLAGRLGYTQTDVDNFGVEADESTQTLLRYWGTKDSSTVELLHRHLIEMKRDDAAKLLEGDRWSSVWFAGSVGGRLPVGCGQ